MRTIITAGAITAIGLSCSWAQEDRPSKNMTPEESQPQEFGASDQRIEKGTTREMESARSTDQNQTREVRKTEGEKGSAESFRASVLMGSRVVNSEGKRLGHVADLAVDMNSGKVDYVIVSAGGLAAGFGGELRPVPSSAFRVRAIDNLMGGLELIVDMDPERWEDAPSIRSEEFAQLDQDKRVTKIREFYHQDEPAPSASRKYGAQDRPVDPQTKETSSEMNREQKQMGKDEAALGNSSATSASQPAYRMETAKADTETDAQSEVAAQNRDTAESQKATKPESRYTRASELIGRKIRNQEKEPMGDLDDLLVNLNDGTVSFVTITPVEDTPWAMANENYVVSPEALRILNRNNLEVSLSPEDMEDAEKITEKELQTAAAGDSSGIFRLKVQPGRPEVYGGRDIENPKR